MDGSSLEHQDRISPAGEISMKENSREKPSSSKDGRIVSANPSSVAAVLGASRNIRVQPRLLDGSRGASITPTTNAYPSHEQTTSYSSYVDFTSTWDGHPQYTNAAEGLHLSPVILDENQSLMFHSGYGYNPEMAYGRFSPIATPLPPVLMDGQLYSPQQIPFSPSFYPHSTPPNAPSPVPSELLTSQSGSENLIYDPGSGYLVQYGSFGGSNMSGTLGSSPLTLPAAYPPPMGILGPYEHRAGQMSEQGQFQGYGSTSISSAGRYPPGISYQSTNLSSGYLSHPGPRERVWLTLNKGRRKENQDSIYSSSDSLSFDRNRGPRASKLKGKSATKQTSSTCTDNLSSSELQSNLYNCQDFVTDYENAKFFIIKSFSEDNVHKSIKYNVWASTPHGNKKLDAVYREAQGKDTRCPIFLLFSVNASGQFCGVAEMVGPVDFEKDADYWQQDRWSGQFPVKWHIIKDVPNSRFRHILLVNNENKPVTHSRDSQEVKPEQGIEMLKIFKDHEALTSMLDDFDFYDQQETALKERKAKQRTATESPNLLDNTMNQMAYHFQQSLLLHTHNQEIASSERNTSSRNAFMASHADQHAASGQLVNDSSGLVTQLQDSTNSGGKSNNTLAPESNGEHQE